MRDTTGTFHAKMGSIKDRNGMDLTEAEDIKKRWQEYTEELFSPPSRWRERGIVGPCERSPGSSGSAALASQGLQRS